MTRNALVPAGEVTPRCQDLIHRNGAGLTMAQFIHRGGKIAALVSNAGYSGPLKPKSYIRDFFSEEEEREKTLDGLYTADWSNLTTQHNQLLEKCHDLLKYALPEYVLPHISVHTFSH